MELELEIVLVEMEQEVVLVTQTGCPCLGHVERTYALEVTVVTEVNLAIVVATWIDQESASIHLEQRERRGIGPEVVSEAPAVEMAVVVVEEIECQCQTDYESKASVELVGSR